MLMLDCTCGGKATVMSSMPEDPRDFMTYFFKCLKCSYEGDHYIGSSAQADAAEAWVDEMKRIRSAF